MSFYYPRPKNRCRRKDPDGTIWHVAKPDADNAAKAVMDALTQEGWCEDDAQIVRLIVNKYYHAKGHAPGADIRVESLKP